MASEKTVDIEETKLVDAINNKFSLVIIEAAKEEVQRLLYILADALNTKYKIPNNDIIEVWNTVAPQYAVREEDKEEDKTPSRSSKKKKSSKEKEEKEVVDKPKCTQILKTGEKCKLSCAKDSTEYCKRHLKLQEKVAVKEPSEIGEKPNPLEITPRLNKKFKVYADPSNGYVMHKKSKIIYARIVDDDLCRLSDDDITELKTHQIHHDEDLIYELHPEKDDD